MVWRAGCFTGCLVHANTHTHTCIYCPCIVPWLWLKQSDAHAEHVTEEQCDVAHLESIGFLVCLQIVTIIAAPSAVMQGFGSGVAFIQKKSRAFWKRTFCTIFLFITRCIFKHSNIHSDNWKQSRILSFNGEVFLPKYMLVATATKMHKIACITRSHPTSHIFFLTIFWKTEEVSINGQNNPRKSFELSHTQGNLWGIFAGVIIQIFLW